MLHNAYGYGLFTGGLGFHDGAQLVGCTVITVSGGMTPRQVLLMQDLGSTALCCTPSYALNIADYIKSENIARESLKLRVGMFGAEPWTEAMRSELQRRLGVVALDVYGLSEIVGPGVACECAQAQSGAHICEDLFLAEIVDPDSGSEGELAFTTLLKQGLPLPRYRTGDISRLTTDPCLCGRTSARMTRVRGRYDDMLIIRGVNLYPSEVERILLSIDDLAPHYQLLLSRTQAMDQLTVDVEVSDSRAASLENWDLDTQPTELAELQQLVSQRLREHLGLGVSVRLHAPNTIPRSEGKAVRVVDRRSS